MLVSTIARSQKSFPGPRGSAQLEESAWLAYQEATRSQAAADAAREETGRVRADAEMTLAAFRADLRARAERAERETDVYRAELAQLRARRPHAHGGRVLAAPQDRGNLFYVNWLRPRPYQLASHRYRGVIRPDSGQDHRLHLSTGATPYTLTMAVCRSPCEVVPTLVEAAGLRGRGVTRRLRHVLGAIGVRSEQRGWMPLYARGPGPA